MRLGLTNTIAARGTPVGGDGLALDLQFAADKTLTARKGPTPTFTRASSGTFVGSNGLIQSAGNNVARFDHDPVTLASRGLLIEESRTNTCLQSENFGTTWANDTGLVSISVDQTTSPSGAMDADKISENTTISNRRIAIQAQSFVSGATYTFSCFVKAAERDFVQLRFGSAFGGQFQNFIVGGVNAGTIGSGTGATAAIQAYPNGWYRCSITATSATTGSSQVTIGPQVSSTATAWQPYVGTIGSGIFVWGAQNEVGSFPTSYIPTTTASVVRSADVCSITGSAFGGFYNQPEGTLVTSSSRSSTNLNAFICHYSDNSFNNGFDLRHISATQVGALMNVANSGQLTGFAGNITAGSVANQAFAYKLNNCGYSLNGAATITDTSALIPTAISMVMGNSFPIPTLCLNGAIASIRYYRKRLPNAKLQALTA